MVTSPQPLPWGLKSHIIRVKWGMKQMSWGLNQRRETAEQKFNLQGFSPSLHNIYHNAPPLIYPPNIHIRVGYSAAAGGQQGAAEVT